MTNLSIRNLWDDVKLMHEIPGVEKWGFEALFQRVVRTKWVNNIKSNYLGNSNRFKFFPPLTIAMLPCENDVPRRTYDGLKSFEFQPNAEGGHDARLPGLTLQFPLQEQPEFPQFGCPARLSWDKSKFTALAIDGQHRLSALRAFVPREGQKADQADVPVAILVFDPKLPAGRDLIQVTREIFIDINKNAKTVDDSRLILLDDRNFYNVLTRNLILQAYADGETPSEICYEPVDKDIALSIPAGVPQELIDTAAGRESADAMKLKEWQYTSAFILSRTLQHFVFENQFKRFEQLLETKDFKAESEDEMESAIASRAVEYDEYHGSEDEQVEDPDPELWLSFQPSTTEKLTDRAMRMHRALLLGTFTAFTPFKAHIERFSKAVNDPDGEDLRSLLLSEGVLSGPATFSTSAAKDMETTDAAKFKRVKKLISSIAKPKGWEDDLVWYSVFQRGVLYQPAALRTAMELGEKGAYPSREKFAEEFVCALNTLHNDKWFRRDASVDDFQIWNGIALKINNNGELGLDGSDGSARRTGFLIRLLAAAVVARKAGGFAHLKSVFGKIGVSKAINEVKRGYSRHKKAVDALAEKIKDDSEYEKSSAKYLQNLLKKVSDEEETKI